MSLYSSSYDVRAVSTFLDNHPNTEFVVVQWLDYLGTLRSRCLPIVEFQKLIGQGTRISISRGNLGTLQNDTMSSACNPVGSIKVEPDLMSLRRMQDQGPVTKTATIMARFVGENDEPLQLCPRASLQSYVSWFKDVYYLEFLVGFEVEITFCRRCGAGAETTFSPLDTNHAWGSFTDEQYMYSMALMMKITTALQQIGIAPQQIHSEAGAGQYEFVLPPLPPVEAVDALIQARQCIMQIAATQNLRATCYPLPFPGIGTAAHAHISLSSKQMAREELETYEMSFMASVLAHLSSICAFTMPQAISYARVAEDSWTSGIWQAWGTENREVPLRRVTGGEKRWEVRCLDGLGNMYLALGAVFGAGLLGVGNRMPMTVRDCSNNPSKLSPQEKEELGITNKLPSSIEAALEALEQDKELYSILSPGLVHHYVTVKHAEQEMLNAMPEKERRIWLMERY